ncbi:MAG: 1-aminocyclopropane-1-carboxylate deaminase [Campylobacter sp.]|nr:1-aminocyclopropane-1-carboxylate deaminase [Campylobacter sp.]
MIEKFKFRGRDFWILRDDLLGVFNGNKARKLKYYQNADLSNYDGIVSHGNAQSNAMYALSVFAKQKNLQFHFCLSHIDKNLALSPCGNFKFALQNGMKFYVDLQREKLAKKLADEKNLLYIPEGVACKNAEFGFIDQAKEIKDFSQKNGLSFDIFLPSGTGTSAAFLAKNIDFDVYTCPCVGDSFYLKEQISKLDPNSKVRILNPPKKYHFAKPKAELYQIWHEICDENKIEFELIYDPVGFLTLEKNLQIFKKAVLYIHQGGILGNQSQISRYEKLNLKDKNENFKLQR